MKRLFSIVLATVCLSAAHNARADAVILRNGIAYQDVKVTPLHGTNFHHVLFRDGSAKKVSNSLIRMLRIKKVNWTLAAKKRRAVVRREPEARRQVAMALKMRPTPLDPRTVPAAVKPAVKKRAGLKIGPTRLDPRTAAVKPAVKKPAGLKIGPTRPDPTTVLAAVKPAVAKPAVERSRGLSPLVRSMILPGWGQYSTGHEWRGGLFFTAAVLSTGYYWNYRQEMRAAEARYNDMTVTGSLALAMPGASGIAASYLYLDGIKQESYALAQKGNNSLGALGLVWLWNVVDIALTSKKLSGLNAAGASDVRLQAYIGPGRIALGLEVNF